MLIVLLILFELPVGVITMHFNGGSITWSPVDPFDNSSRTTITITQKYSWTYPAIKCASNVPTSTSGRSGQNDNLTCVYNCLTDRGYSANLINILTDCTSSSSSLGMMTSEKSVNVTLNTNAYFSIAYRGAAWRNLNSPSQSGLDWSIFSSIDLRRRPDGFINTPPVASVLSPQYVRVNQTTQIRIPFSDVNRGDDIRCRWSIYDQGYRKRRSFDQEQYYHKDSFDREFLQNREKRGDCDNCWKICKKNCKCYCRMCKITTCTGDKCTANDFCPNITVMQTTRTTTSVPTSLSTNETPGTIRTTSSYINRQTIDECGGICYPTNTPLGTSLDNCTLTFTGLVVGAWYAIAIQVTFSCLFV